MLIDGDWKRNAEGIGLRDQGKRLAGFLARGAGSCSRRYRSWKRLKQRSRGGRGLVRVADQLEQMVILDVFDLVSEPDEAAIDVIECAAVELVAELFAANREGMTAGVFAQHQFRIGHAD